MAGSMATHSGPGASAPPVVRKLDPMLNPLRAVLRRFACVPCGRFDPDGGDFVKDAGEGNGEWRCSRCLGRAAGPERFAYTSLIYGVNDKAPLVFGALVLGFSLKASGTPHDRVLLHTHDVSEEALRLLSVFWRLKEVPYVKSAPDLHTTPYETARFKQVFTKLHIFNPDVLPYDRVVFLDADMLVLRNLDELFGVRTPAALYNEKNRSAGRGPEPPEHGGRMATNACYINAGTIVASPSRALFELLVGDVCQPDPQWHSGSWSPEQAYLSRVLAGEWSHICQTFNMEVTLHSGVPVANTWLSAAPEDIKVAHFSGGPKVWDVNPEGAGNVIGTQWVRQTFARLSERCRTNAAMRCRVMHAEWHRCLALALRECHAQGFDAVQNTALARVVRTGSVDALSKGVGGETSDAGQGLPVGEDVTFKDDVGATHLGTVVRILGSAAQSEAGQRRPPQVVVWHTPPPAKAPLCAGPFGLCYTLDASAVLPLGRGGTTTPNASGKHTPRAGGISTPGLGDQAILWTGEGHALVAVVATMAAEGAEEEESLVRFLSSHAPRWVPARELVDARDPDPEGALQCVDCLKRCPGSFRPDGFWYCSLCQAKPPVQRALA